MEKTQRGLAKRYFRFKSACGEKVDLKGRKGEGK